jgi:hypothetical protein
MKYALKKADKVIVRDTKTGKHKCTITQIKSASLANTQDAVYAEGQDNVKLAVFDTNKEATLTFESGVISTGVLATQLGTEVKSVSNDTLILHREEFTLASGATTSVTLTYLAQGESGKEILWIYKADDSGEPGDAYGQNATTASATEFTYNATTGEITLPTGAFTAGDVVIVDYYPKFSETTVLENKSDNFTIAGDVYLFGFFTNLSNNQDEYLQVWAPSGRVGGSFDFSFGDQVAIQSVTVDANAAQRLGVMGLMWRMATYDFANATKASSGD